LASLIQVGPKVLPLFGFDLLFYKGCVDFAMELCKRLGETAVNSKNLYWNLAVIHSLHLVHCDIKPENIMLSPSHCKPVFIDFGLSFFIPENVGEKSLTSFVGSINFCSDEMGRLIFTNNLCRVDLYHNDLCCLKRFMKIYDESFEEAEKEENLTELPSFDYLNLYLLKFLLYSKET
jgi:serine/threonine protein kinase